MANNVTWFDLAVVLLEGSGLEGTLSPDRGLFSDLMELDFRYNEMSGSLPSQIDFGLARRAEIYELYNCTSAYGSKSLSDMLGPRCASCIAGKTIADNFMICKPSLVAKFGQFSISRAASVPTFFTR